MSAYFPASPLHDMRPRGLSVPAVRLRAIAYDSQRLGRMLIGPITRVPLRRSVLAIAQGLILTTTHEMRPWVAESLFRGLCGEEKRR
jgi:hypothetical protein